jgi:putative PIN family toxin of toxin-antitoxin system
VLSATFDTSVYDGALNSRGFSGRLFSLAQAGEIRIDISDAILDETIRVLRDKFAWDGDLLHHTMLRLASFTNRVAPKRALDVVKEDPPDNRILECAVEAGSEYIVTWTATCFAWEHMPALPSSARRISCNGRGSGRQ